MATPTRRVLVQAMIFVVISLLICSIDGARAGDPLKLSLENVQALHADAGIFMYPDFLSQEECDHLISLAEPRLSRSSVVATKANGTGVAVAHDIRTSSGAAFQRGEDAFVRAIEERIALWSMLPIGNQECMQVLQYGPGQQYRTHWDFFQDNTTVQNGGNRHTTVLVYLNDVGEGGETVFPLLPPREGQQSEQLSDCAAQHLAVKPRKGTALLWRNMSPSGQPEMRSLHAGCPVTKGTKYALAKWIRAGEYIPMDELVAKLRLATAPVAAAAEHSQHAQALSQIAAALAVAAAR